VRPTFCCFPARQSVAHLQENLSAAALDLPDDALTALDGVDRPT
jgi:aryl-alcohol dehydrogenase-like predicted oxidoreductase